MRLLPCSFAVYSLMLVFQVSSGVELWLNPNKTTINKKTGDSFLIQCKLFDGEEQFADKDAVTKQPSWTFTKKGEPSTQIGRHGRTHAKPLNSFVTNLLVTESKVGDDGTYRCTAEVSGQVLVREIQIELYESVTFVNAPEIQHPLEHERAKIMCKVTGNPTPQIFWFRKQNSKDNNEFEVNIDSSVFPRVNFEEGGQVLVINSYEIDKDDGLYKCQVNQFESADVKEKNITVKGYVKPKITYITNGTISLHEGREGKLQCGATGVPAPTYSWFKDGTELPSGDEYSFPEPGLLRISEARPVEAGLYVCKAHNDVGTSEGNITVSIFLKPHFMRMISSEVVKKGDDVKVTCEYDGGEPLIAKWMGPGGLISPQVVPVEGSGDESVETSKQEINTIYTTSEEQKKLTLHIKEASTENTGDYSCTVENEAGIVTMPVKIQVEHKPIVNQNLPRLFRAIDNSTVELTCTAESVPQAEWFWYKDGDKISGSDVLIITNTNNKDFQSSQLKITEAKGNYGEFKCEAKNNHGIDQRMMTVLQIIAPAKPFIALVGEHPTKAVLEITNYLGEAVEENVKPRKVELKFTEKKDDESQADLEWNEYANPIFYDYDAKSIYEVPGLKPETSYVIAARGENEAGFSEWYQSEYRTAKPRAPMPVSFVTKNNSECSFASCEIRWNRPEDGGSSLTKYKITFAQVASISEDSTETPQPVDIKWEPIEDVAATEETFQLKNLKSKSTYRVRMYAVNDIGMSEVSQDLIVNREPSFGEEKEEEQFIDYTTSTTKRVEDTTTFVDIKRETTDEVTTDALTTSDSNDNENETTTVNDSFIVDGEPESATTTSATDETSSLAETTTSESTDVLAVITTVMEQDTTILETTKDDITESTTLESVVAFIEENNTTVETDSNVETTSESVSTTELNSVDVTTSFELTTESPAEEVYVNLTSADERVSHWNRTNEFGPAQNLVETAGVEPGAIVAIVIIVVVIIVLLVDVACYYVNQCGLMMCICVKCCGKTPPQVKAKEVAMEEGKLTPDDKRPLRDMEKEQQDGKGDQEDTPMMM